jgi:predicted dehydrogenase
MDVVRIGILGSARIARTALIEAARHVPDVTVAAVAARDLPRAQGYALEHGIAIAHGSYDELLADPGIDAIYNPLPNSLHGPWTLQAITAGKHVLCEKPFAANAASATLVAEAAAASGLVVMEAMHYRYHPLIKRLRTVVAGLGPVRHMQCWTSFVIADPGDIRYDYALGGGALMDGGCYAIDCMRMLAGSPEVSGGPEVSGALADTEPDGLVDRALAARLAFGGGSSGGSGGGATGWFESAFTRSGEFRADLHVTCDGGTAHVDNFILPHEGRLQTTTVEDPGQSHEHEQERGGEGEVSTWTSWVWQLRAFAEAIRTGAPVQTTPENAVATMRVIDDAYRAAGLPTR